MEPCTVTRTGLLPVLRSPASNPNKLSTVAYTIDSLPLMVKGRTKFLKEQILPVSVSVWGPATQS